MDRMPDSSASADLNANPARISNAFLTARALCLPLKAFPGTLPETLMDAYNIQMQSIKSWAYDISGWKVGGVPPHLQDALQASRLAGPIFKPTIHTARSDDTIEMPIFADGFAAVEAEFVLRLGDTAHFPESGASAQDVVNIVDGVFMGVEIASSPLKTINEIGPLAVVSDFGNNFGLLVGPPVDLEKLARLHEISVSVMIDGVSVGQTSCPKGLDGPLGAVAFLIEQLRKLGREIPAGTLVSTGAITGVHEAPVGAQSSIRFEGIGEVNISLVPARP